MARIARIVSAALTLALYLVNRSVTRTALRGTTTQFRKCEAQAETPKCAGSDAESAVAGMGGCVGAVHFAQARPPMATERPCRRRARAGAATCDATARRDPGVSAGPGATAGARARPRGHRGRAARLKYRAARLSVYMPSMLSRPRCPVEPPALDADSTGQPNGRNPSDPARVTSAPD